MNKYDQIAKDVKTAKNFARAAFVMYLVTGIIVSIVLYMVYQWAMSMLASGMSGSFPFGG